MAWVGIFSGALAISVCLTHLVWRGAVAARLLDQPLAPRKIHTTPVPRLGGVAIVGAVYGSLSLGAILHPTFREEVVRHGTAVAALAVGGLAIAGLGLYDDLRGANAKKKFAIQCAVALVLYAAGFRILQVDNPFGPDVALGVLSLPVTVLWIVGVTNAVNLIDGLDGLAAGISIAAAVALAFITLEGGNGYATVIAVAMIGALVGFLSLNVNPASIFMGDTGSLFLGLMLSALGLLPREGGGTSPVVAMTVVLAIPIADTLLAVVRRSSRGYPLFSGDREHVHHRLLDKGLSHGHATLALWVVAALLAAAGTHLSTRAPTRALVLATVMVAGGLALNWAGMFGFVAELRAGMHRLVRFRGVQRSVADLRDSVLQPVASVVDMEGEPAQQLRLAAVGDAPLGNGETRLAEANWAVNGIQGAKARRVPALPGRGIGSGTLADEPQARRNPPPQIDVLGYGVTTLTAEVCAATMLHWVSVGERCRWIACLNPHSYVVGLKNPVFREALLAADTLLPDGTGIVLAARLLRLHLRRRVTGSDLFHAAMRAANRRGGVRVFFLGATEETLATIREKVRVEFPAAVLAGTYSPPFKEEFTHDENEAMIRAVNASRPDVLWVGMTAPKQEVWLHQNRGRLDVRVAAAIGAVFDFYAGRVKRSPRVFQQLGLEWLARLLREPRRLWKRTFVSAPVFLWHAVGHGLGVGRGRPLPALSRREQQYRERAWHVAVAQQDVAARSRVSPGARERQPNRRPGPVPATHTEHAVPPNDR